MEIRPLTEADYEPFWQLRLRALKEHPEAFGATYEEAKGETREQVVARLTRPQTFTLAAVEDGAFIGMAGCFRQQGAKVRHKAYIWGVYTAPEARGRGVAQALIVDIIERARHWPGLEMLQLSVVTENGTARRLYARLGFEVYGLEPAALKLDDRYVDEEHMVLRL